MSDIKHKEFKIDPAKLRAVDAWYWANFGKIKLGSGLFSTKNHEYEVGLLQCDHPNQCAKKGAQMGFTEIGVLKTLHGHIYGKYNQGTLYLFPTWNDITDFSKGRFNPLIYENPQIGKYVKSGGEGGVKATEAATIKRIGGAMLYLRSAKETQKIGGVKATSSALKSVPVDRIVFDEVDEMSPPMVKLAMERISHSKIQEVFKLSTPSIPDYGIDREYKESDQRVWMIKCEHCNTETCLELEFPECIDIGPDGKGVRLCKKCRQEIFPRNGRWVAQNPSVTDLIGWWISQLNSVFIDPGHILKEFRDPSDGNIAEIYNSKLGMAYIEAENRLTKNDIYRCCGNDAMLGNSQIPCAMGVDIGKIIHVVIGYPIPDKKALKVVYISRLNDFNDLHDIARLHNVYSAVLDIEPETRKCRDFQKSEPYKVFLCDYQERMKVSQKINKETGVVIVRRTEILDTTHELVTGAGTLELPRRSSEIDEYAAEMSNIAKVLEEDEKTGSKVYRYRKLGDDHYRHATNYFWLACQDEAMKAEVRRHMQNVRNPYGMMGNILDKRRNEYDPLGRIHNRQKQSNYDPLGR